MEDTEDFLWKVALVERGTASKEGREDIIPDIYELNMVYDHKRSNYFSKLMEREDSSHYLSTNNIQDETQCYKGCTLGILETRSFGLLDFIGGELWEASLLMCSYIINNYNSKFCSTNSQLNHILELGSGVGLPGFLLLWLKLHYPHQSLSSAVVTDAITSSNKSITLSDYDFRALDCLDETINREFKENYIIIPNTIDNTFGKNVNQSNNFTKASTIKACVRHIDWAVFDPFINSQFKQNYDFNIDYDFIFGSALCYSPHHACLANLIQYYLSHGCQEIVIIQIKDREGVSNLIHRLDLLNVDYEIEEIPSIIYDTAQLIQCKTSSLINNNINSNFIDINEADHEKNEHKIYRFPSHLLSIIMDNDDGKSNNFMHNNSMNDDANYHDNLIKTDKESFMMLTARRRTE
eukprot:gene11690-15652_t